MTDLPVYVLVPDWPGWVFLAAVFGVCLLAFVDLLDAELQRSRRDP